MILFHAERRGSFTGDIPLARYEPTRCLWGTLIWHITFELPSSGLLQTSGHSLIRHRCIPLPNTTDTNYAIYANTRIALFSAPLIAQLPEEGTAPGESQIISLEGMNIRDCINHCANVPASSQAQLTGGAYRIELWAASGTDAWDIDGLGALADYNCGNVHQFNVLVIA